LKSFSNDDQLMVGVLYQTTTLNSNS